MCFSLAGMYKIMCINVCGYLSGKFLILKFTIFNKKSILIKITSVIVEIKII